MFLVSPDHDFQSTGGVTETAYTDLFNIYKGVLNDDPESPENQRVFSAFHEGLFGPKPNVATPTPTNNNLNSEVEKFKRARSRKTPNNPAVNPVIGETSTPPSAREPPTQSGGPNSLALASPVEPERLTSIAITSNVSHTVTASSRVSNTTNGNVSPPISGSDIEEDSPPVPKAVQTRGKSKRGSKSSNTTTPPDPNLDDAPATKNPARKTRAASKTASDKVLRTRS